MYRRLTDSCSALRAELVLTTRRQLWPNHGVAHILVDMSVSDSIVGESDCDSRSPAPARSRRQPLVVEGALQIFALVACKDGFWSEVPERALPA